MLFFLFFSLFKLIYTDSHDIFISNQIFITTPNGSEAAPFQNLYSAFSSSTSLSTTNQDQIYFKIVPTTIPYTINDSEIGSGQIFDSVLGFS